MAWRFRRGNRWWIGCRFQGLEYRFSARTTNPKVAERILAKIETEIAEGRFLEKALRSNWTLGRLSEVYLARMDELRPRSAVWRRERFAKVTAELGDAALLEEIDLGTLDRYASTRLKSGAAVSTVNGEIAVLRHALSSAALRWQVETGLSEYRLGTWRPIKGRPKREPVFLPEKKVEALLQAAKRRGGHPYVFLRVFLNVAARPGEILALRPEDLQGRVVRFRTMKGGLDRSATLRPDIARDLKRTLPFSGSGQAKNRYRRFWRAVRDEAKLGKVRLYDLRHTAISQMLRQGMSLREVQRIVGHQTAAMTERYAHFAKDAPPPEGAKW